MAKGKIIIAEIGINYVGDMDLARKLIALAKDNGADLAKLQLYDTNKLSKAPFRTKDVLKIVAEGELNKEQATDLFDYGASIGIEVFFSVADVERVGWCEEMGVRRYKIATTMRDSDTLNAVAKTGKPIIISSQTLFLSSLNIEANLYCVPQYPTLIEDVDFELMSYFDGFSDHTIGLDAAKIALTGGARVIEKHFAIDRETGIDALWSMTPAELKELVGFSQDVCDSSSKIGV